MVKTQQKINIRRAVSSDCGRLLELVKDLATYEQAPGEVTISLEHFEASGFGEHPVWWAFVAETDERIVGFALYYIRFSTWKGQRMYLEDLYIEPEMRGKGIASLLFAQLIEDCRKRKLVGIVWQVLEWNEPAIEFYRSLGARFDGEWLNGSLEVPL